MSAIIFVPLFRKIGLGAILAYLFAGLIIGPHTLRLIEDPEVVLHFSELGVVLLLFTLGLELDPQKLWKLRKTIFGLGFLQVLLTGIVFTIGLKLLQNSTELSIVVGFGLALSSTAFCMQILQEKRQLKTTHGQGTFSILMFQDLAVVPLLTLVSILAGQKSAMLSPLELFRIVFILVLFIIVGLYAIRHALRLVANSESHEVFIATSLCIVVGSALLMESIGLSMGMGAFIAGVLLANSEYRHELESSLEPFKGLLLGLFFISVGMSLHIPILLQKPHWIILGTLSFMTVKSFIIYLLSRAFGFPNQSAKNMAFMLPQGGEFAFVLFGAATTHHILTPEIHSVLTASVTLSMAATPFLFSLNQRLMSTTNTADEQPFDTIDEKNPTVIIAGYGRFGQIVSRFLRAQNVFHTILEHSASQVEASRQFGYKVYYGDASRPDILTSAGIQNAHIFVNAIVEPQKSLEIVRHVQKLNPNIYIICRARNRQHSIELMELGVAVIHRETLMTSLEVAKEVMLKLGNSRAEINQRLAIFRSKDESILKKQFELRHDEKKMRLYTIQANTELEQILQEESQTTNSAIKSTT
ncbi:MAG: monovalent cation:proton antiporter-2 (CPA2) family protein [Bdellovibrionales bacterium]|nr:monovalent cation:proton antiporter-2 (CPA2) family protein [Bdellovibrionales bacterium]